MPEAAASRVNNKTDTWTLYKAVKSSSATEILRIFYACSLNFVFMSMSRLIFHQRIFKETPVS